MCLRRDCSPEAVSVSRDGFMGVLSKTLTAFKSNEGDVWEGQGREVCSPESGEVSKSRRRIGIIALTNPESGGDAVGSLLCCGVAPH